MTDLAEFAGKRILVTGGTGFIGSHLLSRLCELDARVYAVSRRQPPETSRAIEWHQGDLADPQRTRNLVEAIKPQIIYHLASHVVAARNTEAVVPTFQCNLMATVNLLMAAQAVGCQRFILSGSLEEPSLSVTDVVPSSPYAVTKWASGAYARMFHALYQFPAVILRIFMVYGPGQRDLQKLIPYVIGSLVNGKVPKLTSGRRPIDWIYVDDVVEGLVASALAKHVEGKTIDIGSGKVETVRTVVQTLARFMGSDYAPSFGAKPDRQFEQVRVADMHAAKELLGWAPKVSLEEGLKRTIVSYKNNLESSGCIMPEPRTLSAPRRISVIIPCLNVASTVGETLDALVEQAWTADWEVILADNGSTDALASAVVPFKTKIPSLKIVDASAKCGAAYARNVGVHASTGEGLLFCDADDIPGHGWAPALTGALMDHPFVAARFEFNRLNPPSIAAARGGTQVDALQTCRFLPFPHAGAGSLGVSRRLHYEVGGFDETIPIGEDTDYCMRVQLAGQKLVLVPDAVLHYRLRGNLAETYRQGVRYAENAVYLYKKYGTESSWELWRWRAYGQSLRTLLGRTPELNRTPDGKAILAFRLGTHLGALRGSLRFGAPPVMAE